MLAVLSRLAKVVSNLSLNDCFLKYLPAILLLLSCSAIQAIAQRTATTTAITASANGSTVTSVASGVAVTLTATVSAGNATQAQGQVLFCDASPHCTDIHRLGMAQIAPSGKAVFRFTPGIGSHSYKAEFLGTTASAPSGSSTTTIKVTGTAATTTTLTSSGQAGNYTLTATVASTNPSLAPSGDVTFADQTNANSTLGHATLMPGAMGYQLLSAPNPSLGGDNSVVVGDFNGDGNMDLITTQNGTNLNVALGKGDGTFTLLPSVAFWNSSYVYSIVTGDFNADGITDLAVSGSTNQVTILLGNGDGTFTLGSTISTDKFPSTLIAGDLNGDGIADLAVANDESNDISILLGNGDGTFTTGTSIPTTTGPGFLVGGDFNGDGILDLVVLTYGDYTARIFLGNGDGTFANAQPVFTGFDAGEVTAGDFNGDGKLDLAITETFSGIDILTGNGDGTFTDTGFIDGGGNGVDGNIIVGDFNGDGKPDLATNYELSYLNFEMHILFGKGDGTFVANTPIPTAAGYSNLATADFNSDGEPDFASLVQTGNASPYPVNVLLSQGGLTSTAVATGISPVGDTTHAVIASYDGDSDFSGSVSSAAQLQAEPLATQLTLTVAPSTSTYGQQVVLTALLSPNSASSLSTDGETISFSGNNGVLGTGTLSGGVATVNLTSIPAGVNNLQALYSGDANFVRSVSNAVNFSVGDAALTVVPGNASRPYGQANPVLTGSVTGALNGDTFTVTGTSSANLSSPIGTYDIVYTVSGAHVGDYTIVNATGKLTVTVATPAINWPSPAAITYGTPLSATQLDATANTAGSFTYTPAAGKLLGVGAQSLAVTFAPTDTTDFTAGSASTNLTVNKAPLMVSANNSTRIYGTANPAFSGSVSGAVNGDSFTETFTTTATLSSNTGSYPIVPGAVGAALDSYTLQPVNGTLTITQAGSATSLALSNQNLTMTATVTSLTTGTPTGTVRFYEGQTLVGTSTLSGGVATFTASAAPTSDVQVTAQYSGDLNFTSSTSTATALVAVSPATTSLTAPGTGSVTDALTLAVAPGYVGTVQFSCSGLPQNATCSFNPASVTFSASSSSGSVILTINTGVQSNSASLQYQGRRTQALLAALVFGVWGLPFAISKRNRRVLKSLPCLLMLVLGIGLMGSAVGCSGGGGSSATPPATNPTPAGASTVTVTATGTGGVIQTTILTLTVQ